MNSTANAQSPSRSPVLNRTHPNRAEHRYHAYRRRKPNPAEQNRTEPNRVEQIRSPKLASDCQNQRKSDQNCPPESHDLPENTGPTPNCARERKFSTESGPLADGTRPYPRIANAACNPQSTTSTGNIHDISHRPRHRQQTGSRRFAGNLARWLRRRLRPRPGRGRQARVVDRVRPIQRRRRSTSDLRQVGFRALLGARRFGALISPPRLRRSRRAASDLAATHRRRRSDTADRSHAFSRRIRLVAGRLRN